MAPITTVKDSIDHNGADLIESKSSNVGQSGISNQVQMNRLVGLCVVLVLLVSVPLALVVFMGLVWIIDRQKKNSVELQHELHRWKSTPKPITERKRRKSVVATEGISLLARNRHQMCVVWKQLITEEEVTDQQKSSSNNVAPNYSGIPVLKCYQRDSISVVSAPLFDVRDISLTSSILPMD